MGELRRLLVRERGSLEVKREREALFVWRPLYEESLMRIQETMEEDWPFQHYPDGWREKVRDLLAKVEERLSNEVACHYPQDSQSNFGQTLFFLRKACQNPHALTGREVGLARRILLDSKLKSGEPGSGERREALRRKQSEFRKADLSEMTTELLRRLDEAGDFSDRLLLPLKGWGEVPQSLRELCEKSRPVPWEEALARECSSLESLASLFPQVLEQATPHNAFDLARMSLGGFLTHLPGRRLPACYWNFLNRLLKLSGVKLRFAEGDAGEEPSQELLQATGKGMRGTLYQRYYDISTGEEYAVHFHRLLKRRCGAVLKNEKRLRVVRAFRAEESHLLLSGNLFAAQTVLEPSYRALQCAERCHELCLSEERGQDERPYLKLKRHKRVAEAWRQMVFFLSQADEANVAAFVEARLSGPLGSFFQGLLPAVQGGLPLNTLRSWLEPESHD
jgi:hypothetical protein